MYIFKLTILTAAIIAIIYNKIIALDCVYFYSTKILISSWPNLFEKQ